jgi:hypothetical protein
VPTTDRSRLATALGDPLERDLLELFALHPPQALRRRIDRRIEIVLREWRARPAAQRHASRPGRRTAIVGALATALVLAGATGGLQQLYLFLNGPFDLPWHRGVEINQSRVIDGYRVTVERAYADATRLALAISVADEWGRPGTTQLAAMAATVTDEDGEYTSGGGSTSAPHGPFAAANVTWKTPARLPLPAGDRALHVVVPSIMVRDDATPPPTEDPEWNPWRTVPGPWVFDIVVPVDGGGATLTPNAVVDAGDLTIAVPRVIAAPGVVRLEMRIDGEPSDVGWAPVGEIRHAGRVLKFVMTSWDADGSVIVLTDRGVQDAAGEWLIQIDRLSGGARDVEGPWVIRFDAP